MKMYCVLIAVTVLMFLVSVVISVGNKTRYYENGTSVTCLGIVCPLNEIFVPCTHFFGDGRHDTCQPCPSARPRTLNRFDSSAFEDPPVYFACISVLERCRCEEEAELDNPVNCNTTLEPICKCNITAGYYGHDPKACRLSENDLCKLPGYELKQDGSCDECTGDMYKNTHQFGRCLLQPRCRRPLVVDNPGDSAHRRTCKLPVKTPPPDKRVTTRESTSGTGTEYTTLSYSIFNVTASTNPTTPLQDSTNVEWIYYVLGAVGLLIIMMSVICCVCCVIRNKKNERKKRWQSHQQNGECDGLIDNGMGNSTALHSINRNKQSNNGDNRKSSHVFKMLTRMICTKTLNEEKHTLDGNQTPAKMIGDQTPANVIGDQTPAKMIGNQTPAKMIGDQTPAKVIGDRTSGIVYVDEIEIKEKVNSNGITEKENSDEIAESEDVYGTFIEMNGDGTVEEVNCDGTSVNVNGDETAENVNGDETAEKVNGDETAEKVNGDETAEKVNGDETAEKVNGDETAEKVNGDETAEKVNGDETAEKVNGDETAEKVNGDETAENVTNIESCENTTTNPCTSYTKCSSLDVNSLFSSGKISSGFVDDMYILEWNPMDDSSSKGFIEYTDSSGKQLKSMTINNGNQGRILLKMPDKGKKCNFIFVSSCENCKIESFVHIMVEPVTNIDLSTLLKSGLSTLKFSSFEIVQKRPDEDLSYERDHSRSLGQPHHMSLPHSQHQADSGISDTTKCCNQSDDSIPHLSLSSLNQDLENDEN